MKETILRYLTETYRPEAIITYGSYADGSANEHSDFDALLIAEGACAHDGSVVGGVTLDVFLYPASAFAGDYAAEDFVQVYDGVIEWDQNGTARKLQEKVREYLQNKVRSAEEIRQEIGWCQKMLLRTEREDAEGYFRRHWLLTDSLEIYFDTIGQPYFGPKKALRYLAAHDAEAYRIYENALRRCDRAALTEWIRHLAHKSC